MCSSGSTLLGKVGKFFKAQRDGDRLLQLLVFNEEFLVSASHQVLLLGGYAFFKHVADGPSREFFFGVFVQVETLQSLRFSFKLEVRGHFVSALSAEVGNITNISFFEPNEENMFCFVTFWCEQAKLRARPRAVW